MRASRFKSNHNAHNDSIFTAAARREQAVERARKQVFQYRDRTDNDKLISTGPTVKMAFCVEDGTKIDKEGIEWEYGGRIHKTDKSGCITAINTQWLRDRQVEANDERDHIYSLLETIMDIEDDTICEQVFGDEIWQKVSGAADFGDGKKVDCRPSVLSCMPVDSLLFAAGQARLKQCIKERNLAPDQLLSAGHNQVGASASGKAVPEGLEGILGVGAAPDS